MDNFKIKFFLTNLKTHTSTGQEKKKKNQTNKQKHHHQQQQQIVQLFSVVPELVTVDSSLKHVLQGINTQPYHIKEFDGLGLYVRLSLFIDKTMLGQDPLHCFSKTKKCRVVIPEIWVSKPSSCTGLGLYLGSPDPKAMFEMTKPCCKTMNIFCRPWDKCKLSCKEGCMIQYYWEFSSTLKTDLPLQEHEEDKCKSLIKAK